MKPALAAVAALLCAACGAPPLMKLPAGPGAPAPDAADALAMATARCRGVRTLTAEVGVSGSAAGSRVRGRLVVGVAAPASARLEAVAPFGPPVFIVVATGDDATLVLPRDNRVLEHGRPETVLEAVAGVPLGAADLLLTLTGCATAPGRVQGRRIGDWRIVTPTAPGGSGSEREWYVQRDNTATAWRLVATVHRPAGGPWRAEYGDFQNGLPRSVRLAAHDSNRFDLRLALSQVEINAVLDADVFKVHIPRTAEPIALHELRRSGLFGTTPTDGR